MSGTLPPADGKPGGQWGKVQKRVVLEPSEVRRNVKENGKRTTKQPNTQKNEALSLFLLLILLALYSVGCFRWCAGCGFTESHSLYYGG